MVTIIKSTQDKATVIELLKKTQVKKGFDAKKYCGVLSLDDSPLNIQLKLRNEWE